MQTWTAHHRLGRLVALAVGGFLLPWCVVLGATLPASTLVPNWSLAWVGLDLAEAVAALLTGVLLTRGSDIRLPLAGQELERALARQGHGAAALEEGKALLDRYLCWAPTVDRFSPVLVETDFEATVLDPDGAAVVTAGGESIRYRGRIDLMVVDQHDAYWIVRHRVVDGDWGPTDELVADEEALAACWAWEQFYLKRPPEPPEEGRLGGRSWAMGRGAAPPKFRGRPAS